MSKKILLILSSLVILSWCSWIGQKEYYDTINTSHPDTNKNLCSTEVCKQYEKVWKDIFLKNNTIDENYFNNRIILDSSKINDWNDGTFFSVCYRIKIDWTLSYNCDQFIVKIKEGNTTYPILNIPRGADLTNDDIQKAIDISAFGSEMMTNLWNIQNTNFSSVKDAICQLEKSQKIKVWNAYATSIKNWSIILSADKITDENNSCPKATINLVNWSTNVTNQPCAIY